MAEQLLDQVRELSEGQIDFEGQRLVEFLVTAFLAAVGAVSFMIGVSRQDIKLALCTGLIGTAFTFALVVPPWPFFNRHPVKWLSAKSNQIAPEGIIVDDEYVS